MAKCYLNEVGSIAVRQLAETEEALCCCEFGRIEVFSTFHRKLA
jgi:hypothetical protein